jgi:broad specificity phosphatase PhoE
MIVVWYKVLQRSRKRWVWSSALLPTVSMAFHTLLPYPPGWTSSSSSQKVVEQLQFAGVSRVFFLRHGQTGKSETGLDFDRYLTDTGRQQARVAGGSYGKEFLLPLNKKVLVSPAPRTVETAELFIEAALEEPDTADKSPLLPQLVHDTALYDNTMQPAGSQLFAKYGYAPLYDYLNAADIDDRQAAQQVLGEYAAAAIDAIQRTVRSPNGEDTCVEPSTDNSKTTLLVVAHAIYLPSAALALASLIPKETTKTTTDQGIETILATNTREAEGYLIDLSTAQVRYLSRPSDAT